MADAPAEKTAISLDDLLKMGEDARVEIIDGEIVEMPAAGEHTLSSPILNSDGSAPAAGACSDGPIHPRREEAVPVSHIR
jgi:hypothetical protein